MKIVIDVPEEIYERCRKYILHCGEAEVLEGAVANGTPLEKIRDEILKLDDPDYDFEGYYKAVTDALTIIDKYRGDRHET